ncbi:MAG TPA: hypothetical protein VK759_05035 [Rhizomicrobium sp.]|nr:hypothetical protein [Rhizomicrobium sp.]HSZ73310.1 hypothetical protein [Rhizomicrobium sp.]
MSANSLALAAFFALATTAAWARDESDPVPYETVISAPQPAPQTVVASADEPRT